MSKFTQKEAVYSALVSVCGVADAGSPTKAQKQAVHDILVEGFKAGTIELSRSYTDQELKNYVTGLLNNWLRKDTRLNGGVNYVPKNPGSRAGSGDAQLKALRALMSTLTDPADRAEVQRHIDARTAELNAAKQPEIDFSKLPAELAAKFKKN